MKSKKNKSRIMAALLILVISVVLLDVSIYGKSNDIKIYINGTICNLDKPPVVVKSNTLVPSGAFLEALGAKVILEANTNTVVAIRNGIIVRIPTGSLSPSINENSVKINVPAQIISGSVYIPLRFAVEAFGGNIDTKGSTNTIKITIKDNSVYKPLSLDSAIKIIYIPKDYVSIQKGVDSASDGDIVLVAQGTYTENIDFHGKNITVTSENGPDKTIINGSKTDTTVSFLDGEGKSAVLNGFTITNGLAGKVPFGGGILIRNSSPTISNCIITKNASEMFGGGINIEGLKAMPEIKNNLISKNLATERGGGIEIRDGASPRIAYNTIIDNITMDGAGIEIINGSSPVITGNIVSNNIAGYDFDGDHARKFLDGGDVTVNMGQSIVFPGGILVTYHSSPVIKYNIITGNAGGGLGIIQKSAPDIEDNFIDNNNGFIADGVMISQNSAPIIANNFIRYKNGTSSLWIDNTSSILDNQHRSVLSVSTGINTNKSIQKQVIGPVTLWPLPSLQQKSLPKGHVLNVPGNYKKIQDAIKNANDGDTVIVAPGVYKENLDFLGKRITVKSLDSGDKQIAPSTIIEAETSKPAVSFKSGENRDTVLIGFTIRNKNNGTGIYVLNSSPSILSNIISGCAKSGITLNDHNIPLTGQVTSPLIKDNLIEGNTGDAGGGISMTYSSPEITGNTITDNIANGAAGILIWFSTPVISNNNIEHNKANTNGGAMYIDHYSQPVIRGNTISWNSAVLLGGGIVLDDFCNAVIDCNKITDNEGSVGSGLSMLDDCFPKITNSIFANNANGGVYLNCSSPEFTNDTFIDNYNQKREWGMGIYSQNKSQISLTNSIFYKSNIMLQDQSITVIASHSLFFNDGEDLWPGEGNMKTDPNFAGNGDYHLLPSSPCIDAGIKTETGIDIDGNIRPQGSGYDIGAYEYVKQ